MEFSSRGFQRNGTRPASNNAAPTQGGGAPAPESNGPVHKKAYNKLKSSRLGSILGGILFVSIIILIIAMIIGVSTRSSERSFVNSKEYQAVFLEGGQVYFGKVKSLNDNYINLVDIYYLNVDNQSVQPESSASQQNLSLVKLGCELHGPRDQMIINRDQVTFWENLKNDSRVAEAIKEWQEQNKDGQKCDEQAATQQQNASEAQDDDAPSNSSPTGNSPSSNNPTSNTPTGNNSGANATQPNSPSTPPASPTPSAPEPTPAP